MTEKELLDIGYKKYEGETYDIYFKRAVCKHYGYCIRSNQKVFQLSRKPWILPTETDKESAITAVIACPSGALKYKLKDSDDIKP